MDEADWLSVWDVEPGPLITLSTLAAHRLQVVLVEVGPEEWPRWASGQVSPPPAPKAGEDVAADGAFRPPGPFARPRALPRTRRPRTSSIGGTRRSTSPRFGFPVPGRRSAPADLAPGPESDPLARPRRTRQPGCRVLRAAEARFVCLHVLPRLRSLGAGRGGREAGAELPAAARRTRPRSSIRIQTRPRRRSERCLRPGRTGATSPGRSTRKSAATGARRNEGRKALRSTRVEQG